MFWHISEKDWMQWGYLHRIIICGNSGDSLRQ